MLNGSWTVPEGMPKLAEGAVHVWRLRLGGADTSRQELRGLLDRAYAALTSAERERAGRMRAGAPREEFVAARGCLRRLLGAELETDPRMLVLETGAQGKPRLGHGTGLGYGTGLRGGAGLEFNVAHSRGMVLLALSRAGAVGVDVEYIDAAAELAAELGDVARTAFHAADLARIEGAATQDGRLAEFYRCWTRKEAVLKADGRGLSGELAEFAVGADGPVAFGGKCWFVRGIEAGACHKAALAAARDGVAVQLLELSPNFPLLHAE